MMRSLSENELPPLGRLGNPPGFGIMPQGQLVLDLAIHLAPFGRSSK